MLPYHARYQTIQRPRDKPKPIPAYWPCTIPRDDPRAPTKVHCIGHCIRLPTDEVAIRFLIYESRIKSSLWPGAPRMTYLNQISSHILQSGEKSLEAGEIRKMAVNKSEFVSQLFVVSKKKKPPDRSSKFVRLWWWLWNKCWLIEMDKYNFI